MLYLASYFWSGVIAISSGSSSSCSPMTARPGFSRDGLSGSGRFLANIVPLYSSSGSSSIPVRIRSLLSFPSLSNGPGISSSESSFFDYIDFFFARFFSFLSALSALLFSFLSFFNLFFSSSSLSISFGTDGVNFTIPEVSAFLCRFYTLSGSYFLSSSLSDT